jgi:hypothetical protein
VKAADGRMAILKRCTISMSGERKYCLVNFRVDQHIYL